VAQIGCAASKYLPVVYLKNMFKVQEAITTTLYPSLCLRPSCFLDRGKLKRNKAYPDLLVAA
jgi:hypothetical protein